MLKKALPALGVGLILLTCADDVRRAAGTVLRDAGTTLLGMDATAQDGATPTDRGRVITADTDLSRLETGIVAPGTGTLLATGPIVITDLSSGDSISFWIASAANGCTPGPTSFATGADQSLAGARIAVRAGEVFCGYGQAGMLWSGFRPYE